MSAASFDLQSSKVQLLPDTENLDSTGNPINYYAEYDYNRDSSVNFKYDYVVNSRPRTKLIFDGFVLGIESSYLSSHSPNFTIDSEKLELPGVEYSLYKFPIKVVVKSNKFPSELRVKLDGTNASGEITERLGKTKDFIFFDSEINYLSTRIFQLAYSSDPSDTNIYLSNDSEGVWDISLTSYWKAEAVGPEGPGTVGESESDPEIKSDKIIVDLDNDGNPIYEDFISSISISF